LCCKVQALCLYICPVNSCHACATEHLYPLQCAPGRSATIMASPRCEKCRLITSEFTFNEEDRHSAIVHHNVEDLERSAAEGCDLCRLIRHSAVHDPLYNRAVTVSISLHHCRWLLREPYISIRLPHSTARGREGPTIRVLESRSDNLGEFGDEGVFSYRRAIRESYLQASFVLFCLSFLPFTA